MSASPLSMQSPRVPSRAAVRRLWLRRAAYAVGTTAVIFIVCWGLRDDEISPVAPDPVPPLIIEQLRNFTVRRDGKRLWEFNAREVQLSPDGSQTLANGVSRGVLFRDDKPYIKLSATRVRLSNNSNDVWASGQVRASGNDRFTVLAPLVIWNYAKKLLSCPDPLRAQLREFQFLAPHLDYNWEQGDLTCRAPVELRAPGIRLRAGNLHASTKTHIITLGGGADLTFDPKTARLPKNITKFLP